LMSTNLTPLTTLPSRTSKQGIILLAKLIVWILPYKSSFAV
jgi:hypothetical protein